MTSTGGPLPGGWSNPVLFNQTYTVRARACCAVFQGQAMERLNHGKEFEAFSPISYQTQVVAGTNYKILISVGGDARVQMTVFWGLGAAVPQLMDVEWWKKKSSKKKGKAEVGGWSDPVLFNQTDTVDRARACCAMFQGEAEKRLNNSKAFMAFAPISYQTQVVAGTNYKILISVGGDARVQMTVFWGLGAAVPQLVDVEWWTLK
ncbi:uncharacterized protein LOC144927467 [Branchiostoma floridae x Branchiostoma belcheri]